jgi:hypothetical protein
MLRTVKTVLRALRVAFFQISRANFITVLLASAQIPGKQLSVGQPCQALILT